MRGDQSSVRGAGASAEASRWRVKRFRSDRRWSGNVGALPLMARLLRVAALTGGIVSFAARLSAEPAPDTVEPREVVVAAVHSHAVDASKVDPGCESVDANCAVVAQVRRAAMRGARLIVTAEYALDQSVLEPLPKVGQRVGNAEKAPLLTRFGKLASEVGAYLVINLRTKDGTRRHNTQVAFAPSGKVVGVHNKFELYGGENDVLTPGQDVTVFDTPYGRVGLLICADLYGDPSLHRRLSEDLGAEIVAVSSQWTVAGATRWQAAFARDWGVAVVAANASGGAGRGSGVFSRTGDELSVSHDAASQVLVAKLPVAHGANRRRGAARSPR